jgi:glycosyltransferase involved in cell wall biosynthesis
VPKLSIITVNLNNEAGLADTAESVINQTWDDYEWIIIDGGSADGSAGIIDGCAGRTAKLVYHCSEKDGGIYQGMNKGVARARGEYCYFLNSGDCLRHPAILEEIFAIGFDEDIVCGDAALEETGGGGFRVRKSPDKMRPADLLYGSVPHQDTLIKTELLRARGGYRIDYAIAADWAFCAEAICLGAASYRHIPETFALTQRGGISEDARFWGLHKAERARGAREIFSARRRLLYFFSAASLKSKIHKIGYRLCKIFKRRARGRGRS